MMRRFLCVLLAVFLLPSCCFAWGYKEHIQLSRMAVQRILDDPTAPAEFKDWLKANFNDLKTPEQERDYFLNKHIGLDPSEYTGIAHWVCVPDIRANDKDWKDKKTEPFDAPERINHYIDMEFLQPDVARRVYKHDLSNLLAIDQFPRDPKTAEYKEAGLLPFAIENAYKQLVDSWKNGRNAPDAAKPDDENNAVKWSGFLIHYLGDNFQPLHATADYKCASYFANKRTAPNVHAEIEWRMNDDEKELFPEMREEFWQAFTKELASAKDDADLSDMWKATLVQATASYKYIPLIGVAAQKAAGQEGTPEQPKGAAGKVDTVKFFHYEGEVEGQKMTVLQMKAHQQALAVLRIERVLRQAWKEAHP